MAMYMTVYRLPSEWCTPKVGSFVTETGFVAFACRPSGEASGRKIDQHDYRCWKGSDISSVSVRASPAIYGVLTRS